LYLLARNDHWFGWWWLGTDLNRSRQKGESSN
jgi:hypothetical protein